MNVSCEWNIVVNEIAEPRRADDGNRDSGPKSARRRWLQRLGWNYSSKFSSQVIAY
jgi:hypothetical protein